VIVFSNAGPIMALGKLGALDILFKLFDQVNIPTAVHREVVVQGKQQGQTDAIIADIAIRQQKLKIVDVANIEMPTDIASLPLDQGEKEAIYLGTLTPNSLVLLDDLKARNEAKALGLSVKGTLGIIIQSYRQDQRSLSEIEALIETIIDQDDIWISPDLCRSVLKNIRSQRD
jgi:uncharacterized protein